MSRVHHHNNNNTEQILLTPEQLNEFHRNGFVVVRNVFQKSDLEPLKKRVSTWINEVAIELHNAKILSKLYMDLPFDERLAAIEKEVPGIAARMHIAKVVDDNKLSAGHLSQYWKESRDIWGHDNLLNLVEQCLETKDIAAHPVFNLRLRVPVEDEDYDVFHTVPYHQDQAYNLPESDHTCQIGAWIPLVNVNKEKMNGPMEFVKWQHHGEKILNHKNVSDGSWYLICDDVQFNEKINKNRFETVVPDVNIGDIILFNSWVPHRSLPNEYTSTRISFDMRWQNANEPHGAFGGKLIQLRSEKNANFQIDWTNYLPKRAKIPRDENGKYVGRWGKPGKMKLLEEIFHRTGSASDSVPIVGGKKREKELKYFKLLREGKINEQGEPI